MVEILKGKKYIWPLMNLISDHLKILAVNHIWNIMRRPKCDIMNILESGYLQWTYKLRIKEWSYVRERQDPSGKVSSIIKSQYIVVLLYKQYCIEIMYHLDSFASGIHDSGGGVSMCWLNRKGHKWRHWSSSAK